MGALGGNDAQRSGAERRLRYLLFEGSVDDAIGWQDGPNLWWPDDRAWCVASKIDFGYTYVGGSHELIKEVLAHPELEAVPADLDEGVTYDSDKINLALIRV